ncbi:hypothetical protein D3C80_1224230 [compost metagenome]
MKQRFTYSAPYSRLRDGDGQPQNARHVDAGAHIHARRKLLTGNKTDAREHHYQRCRQPGPRGANPVPALRHPHHQHHRQKPGEPLRIAPHRFRGSNLLRMFG